MLAAFLTPSDYGVWGVLAVSLGALLFFKAAGIGDRFVAQDSGDQTAAFQRALTAELVLTSACVALMAIAVPVLILVYDLPSLLWPSVVIALTLLVSVFQAPQWIFYRRMDFVAQRVMTAVDPVVGFVVSVGLAVAGAGLLGVRRRDGRRHLRRLAGRRVALSAADPPALRARDAARVPRLLGSPAGRGRGRLGDGLRRGAGRQAAPRRRRGRGDRAGLQRGQLHRFASIS